MTHLQVLQLLSNEKNWMYLKPVKPVTTLLYVQYSDLSSLTWHAQEVEMSLFDIHAHLR